MKIQLAAYVLRDHISTEFIQISPHGQEKYWSYSYIIHDKLWQLTGLGVSIHSFCSAVPSLSHMSPMFRLSISNYNESISGFQCHYEKAG